MAANIDNIKLRYNITGNNDGLNNALNIAVQVAPTDLSVLIVGESGVGKEVIPRIIHDHSPRKHNQYFAINCGSIPEGTIDSELFGHVKGSFTGALSDREGYFGSANNGTLFLDEVGELPLATQARLLRVLETGEYIRVGESQVRKTNVRIVAATNVNMLNAIKEGRFREDLYYRLNTIPITLPPLRDRGADIVKIFKKFAYDMSDKYRVDPIRLTPEAEGHLMSYKWPGNVRELRNKTEQMSILCTERIITPETLMKFGITDDGNSVGGIVQVSSGKGKHTHDEEINGLLAMIQATNMKLYELSEKVDALINGYTPQTAPTSNRLPIFSTGTKSSGGMGVTISHDSEGFNEGDFIDISQEPESPYAAPQKQSDEPKSLKQMEYDMIVSALARHKDNRRLAAKDLDISTRTLYRKLKEYGLTNENDVEEEDE